MGEGEAYCAGRENPLKIAGESGKGKVFLAQPAKTQRGEGRAEIIFRVRAPNRSQRLQGVLSPEATPVTRWCQAMTGFMRVFKHGMEPEG
ncbi:MAG: hypothetical protein B9S32_12510 [Verrucomicrobia bacterium Tous-C9LFEB]|nr:MAG: hypothetical protein B9S32_12510 [Verrucomicrobia bacterium Tous-C9LFEB]